jgi:hypothetical protein
MIFFIIVLNLKGWSGIREKGGKEIKIGRGRNKRKKRGIRMKI